jgi:hypothetical protein
MIRNLIATIDFFFFSKNETFDFEKKIKPIIEVIDEPIVESIAQASQNELAERLDDILNLASSNKNTDAVILEESKKEAESNDNRRIADDDFELLD